jgi:aldose 1-epimerase
MIQENNDVIKLNSDSWLAEIAVNAGANLFRLHHKPSDLEILRSPESLDKLSEKPQVYGIPVLFPPNRIANGKFNWNGQEYSFELNEAERNNHLHGLILGKPWQLSECENDKVMMTYDFEATHGFPHDFQLKMSYHFTPEAVIQKFSVKNNSKLPMPFGLGFHTAFRMPSNAKTRITTGDNYWEVNPSRHLPSGKLLPWNKKDHIFTNDQAVSCHCPITTEIIDGKAFRGAIIEYPDENIKLYYEVDEQYKHWCLWNNGGNKGFFCPEPMTWMVNAPNLNLPPEITGMQALAPNRFWQAKTRIHLTPYINK